MKAPNHVIGGLVFTGIFCSFWNVNIFSSPWYLTITVFTSLLPDIDHTRSLIGKMFLPIAKYLDRNYGHRTITHSLIFTVALYLLVYLFSHYSLKDSNIPMIFIFAMSSHLIFDMLTIQGVPLFYPFKRNPCVIPGNPDHRLKGHFSTEFVIFAIFLLLLYFCFPLFENGFWISYDKNYNTLKHLHKSATISKTVLAVEFDYHHNSNQTKGHGLLLNSADNEAVIYDSTNILIIENHSVITTLQPTKSDLIKQYQYRTFRHIQSDSLNQLLDAIIVEAQITSERVFNIIRNNILETTKKINMKWINKPQLSELDNPQWDEVKMKELELKHMQKLYAIQERYHDNLKNQVILIKKKLNSDLSDYTRELLTKHLRDLEKECNAYVDDNAPIQKLTAEVELLKAEASRKQTYTGQIKSLHLIPLKP